MNLLLEMDRGVARFRDELLRGELPLPLMHPSTIRSHYEKWCARNGVAPVSPDRFLHLIATPSRLPKKQEKKKKKVYYDGYNEWKDANVARAAPVALVPVHDLETSFRLFVGRFVRVVSIDFAAMVVQDFGPFSGASIPGWELLPLKFPAPTLRACFTCSWQVCRLLQRKPRGTDVWILTSDDNDPGQLRKVRRMHRELATSVSSSLFVGPTHCEVFIIPSTDPRVDLRGQKGLRVKAGHSVMEGDIIDLYQMLYLLESEPKPEEQIDSFNTYSFSLKKFIPGLCGSAVEGYGNSLTRFINHFAINPHSPSTAQEQRARQNVRFHVTVNEANHVPLVHVQALRDIAAGKELLLDYGTTYFPKRSLAGFALGPSAPFAQENFDLGAAYLPHPEKSISDLYSALLADLAQCVALCSGPL